MEVEVVVIVESPPLRVVVVVVVENAVELLTSSQFDIVKLLLFGLIRLLELSTI